MHICTLAHHALAIGCTASCALTSPNGTYTLCPSLSACLAATTHFPENLHRCFLINVPSWACGIWYTVKPLVNARTQAKVSVSSGVPADLKTVVGGDEALQRVLSSVPPKLPRASAAACDVDSAVEVE